MMDAQITLSHQLTRGVISYDQWKKYKKKREHDGIKTCSGAVRCVISSVEGLPVNLFMEMESITFMIRMLSFGNHLPSHQHVSDKRYVFRMIHIFSRRESRWESAQTSNGISQFNDDKMSLDYQLQSASGSYPRLEYLAHGASYTVYTNL